MANFCTVKQSQKFQMLSKMSGVSTQTFDAVSKVFLNKYGRLPYLDEVVNANSESYLKEKLQIDNDGFTHINRVLEYTGSDSIEESTINLNNLYRDLNIEILDYINNCEFKINHRPTEYDPKEQDKEDPIISEIDKFDNKTIIEERLYQMKKLFGIKINNITIKDLSNNKWKDIIPNASLVKAFVYNGEIFINTDLATVEDQIHELMHIFLGGVRYTNPDVYMQILNKISELPNLPKLADEYKHRSENDVLEEIFVNQFSKYLKGIPSIFDQMSQSDLYNIEYEVLRNLDSFIDGNYSVKSIEDWQNKSLKELTKLTQSDIMTNSRQNIIDMSKIHREMANQKEDLLKKGTLIQIC